MVFAICLAIDLFDSGAKVTGDPHYPAWLRASPAAILAAGIAFALACMIAPARAQVPGATKQASATRSDKGPAVRAAAAARTKPGGLSARTLDELLAAELKKFGVQPGQPISDEQFLRRVYLDVVGHIPPPDRIDAFLNDRRPRKRSSVIRELLQTPEYARHWGRFWTDVITIRTRGEDDHLKPESMRDWFARQVAANTPWNEVVRQLITATGRNDQSGPANFILAQMARPEDLGAETARVFLGVKLQCAQCHDDPNGVWKREQFHGLAAFFGRLDEERVDVGPQQQLPLGMKPPTPPFQIIVLDQARREYMMPDKDDASRFTAVAQPRPLQGPPLPHGLSDAERREFLAAWVTGPNNMWFPRAFVNRVWTELMGAGFTSVVDDMGPDRPLICPTVLYRVAAAWRTSGYDVHWLMELLLNSQAYQSCVPVDSTAEPARLAGVTPSPLEPQQILASLAVALDLDPAELPAEFRDGVRHHFEFDPSTPLTQLAPSVSQVLLMMNHSDLADLLAQRVPHLIAELLSDSDDSTVIEALYLRALARRPTPRELEECCRYAADVDDRQEAFEDLLWCLINSTEFVTKR
jgi:hypothetical protein